MPSPPLLQCYKRKSLVRFAVVLVRLAVSVYWVHHSLQRSTVIVCLSIVTVTLHEELALSPSQQVNAEPESRAGTLALSHHTLAPRVQRLMLSQELGSPGTEGVCKAQLYYRSSPSSLKLREREAVTA